MSHLPPRFTYLWPKHYTPSVDRIPAAPTVLTWAAACRFKVALIVSRVCRSGLVGTPVALEVCVIDRGRTRFELEISYEHGQHYRTRSIHGPEGQNRCSPIQDRSHRPWIRGPAPCPALRRRTFPCVRF